MEFGINERNHVADFHCSLEARIREGNNVLGKLTRRTECGTSETNMSRISITIWSVTTKEGTTCWAKASKKRSSTVSRGLQPDLQKGKHLSQIEAEHLPTQEGLE